MQSLVDEPYSLNGQLSFPPGEERDFFSGPTTLAWLGGPLDDPFIVPGLMRPSMVEPSDADGGEGPLTTGIFAVELRGPSRGGSCWDGRISGSAAEVIRSLCCRVWAS